MYVPGGFRVICSLCFKSRSVTVDSDGAGRQKFPAVIQFGSYSHKVTYTNVVSHAAGQRKLRMKIKRQGKSSLDWRSLTTIKEKREDTSPRRHQL